MHVKSLSLRHILHEIVFVINENLCGRFRKALQAHAYYTQSILHTKPLLHKHVQLLIFVLDNIETKIDPPPSTAENGMNAVPQTPLVRAFLKK